MLKSKYTAEDIEIRIWGFVVVCITIILFGIVFVLLYSLIFVVQPIKSMAPLDMAFSKILNDIVLLLVGGIGGIVGKRAVGAVSQAVTPTPPPTPVPAAPAPSSPVPAPPSGALPVWINPPLDESWTPPPPPTTPPEHLEPDHVREEIAAARREAGQ
ncbi:hypothetical protein UFOVP1016_20 [uncultured Caudovirales phage]|uniref:Uncharacterized protein n=1 Tax=uncultured Caudovirales phage TaxID=2100421 RepID=A0A6J5Q8Z6_9CAUD|nr:hypothetical protein UFOVP1016_20 [uncultured Caudovirales phage]